MKGVVYKYTLKEKDNSEVVYIGATTDECRRREKWKNTNYSYSGRKLEEKRKEYGVSSTRWEYKVLVYVYGDSIKELKLRLDQKEQEFIRIYDSVNKGLNTSYGRGNQGIHLSAEHKNKISKANKGQKRTTMTLDKMKKWHQDHGKKVKVIIPSSGETIYPTISDAARELGWNSGQVFYYLKNGNAHRNTGIRIIAA